MLTQEELDTIRMTSREWCVSVSFPTSQPRPFLQEDSIKLKNALHQAEQQLAGRGLRAADARNLLAPAAHLLEERSAAEQHGKGIVLYLAPGFFRCWDLQAPPPAITSVGRRFSLKPVLPYVSKADPFFVLAISQHHVRLLSCTEFDCREVALPETPTSLTEALWTDDPERQLQFHTGAGGPSGARGGRRPAVYHGHGVGIDDTKDRIVRFLREVDKGVAAALAGHRTPLVLAGVESLFPLYREVTTYPCVLEEGLRGNPEHRRAEELQEDALKIVAPYLRTARREAIERFQDLASTNRATSEPKEVALAAADGRAGELFVVPTAERWAVVRLDQRAIEPCAKDHPEAEDLVDVAIRETVAHGARIHALDPHDMPTDSPLAASLRY